jgi:hypothetical protein
MMANFGRINLVVLSQTLRGSLRVAMAAMADPKAKAAEVARRLGITTTTLYAYVNGDGAVKQAGQALLDRP